MDIIFIRDVQLETLIGAYEHERLLPRTLQFNIEIGPRELRACRTDVLADTLDHAAVVALVRAIFSSHAFHLPEPLAASIGDRILQQFDAHWVRIDLSKSGVVPNAREVGVRIERSR